MKLSKISLAGKNGTTLAIIIVGIALMVVSKWLSVWFIVLGLLIILGAILATAIVQIEGEEAGAQKIFGAVSRRVLNPGWRWIVPFFTQITRVSTKKNTYRHTETGIEPADGFQLSIKYAIFAAFNPKKVYLFLEKYNLPIDENYLIDIMEKILRDVYVKYTCDQLRTDEGGCRTIVQEEVHSKFMDMVASELDMSLFTEINVIIQNYDYSDEYRAYLDRVKKAEKEAEAAEAEKKAKIIKAEGLKKCIILEAEGKAEGIKVTGEATASALEKKGDVLKSHPEITTNDAAQKPPQTLVVGSGFVPMVDVINKTYPTTTTPPTP